MAVFVELELLRPTRNKKADHDNCRVLYGQIDARAVRVRRVLVRYACAGGSPLGTKSLVRIWLPPVVNGSEHGDIVYFNGVANHGPRRRQCS